MKRLMRPRTERQREASTALVNVAFAALIIWLLAGRLPAGLDPMPTVSVTAMANHR